jgi:hypothetical protein
LCLEPVDADFIVATQAAGFRQRREGLAYRLTWPKLGIRPRKRVEPASPASIRRRLIYRSRAAITRWSHRVYAVASGFPRLYLWWAKAAVGFYHGAAYSRGWLGRIVDRFLTVRD